LAVIATPDPKGLTGVAVRHDSMRGHPQRDDMDDVEAIEKVPIEFESPAQIPWTFIVRCG
jgi:hypothetical protein